MSNVIKSSYYFSAEETKLIEVLHNRDEFVPKAKDHPKETVETIEEIAARDEQIQSMKEQIIRDAEQFAEQQIQQAMEEAEAIKEQAALEAEHWWQEQRNKDEQHISSAKQSGYELGFQLGLETGESSIREQHGTMLEEAKLLLEQAYALKRQIIQEAEPFLVELSCEIAHKIIGQQLELMPETIKEMARKVLELQREKGTITLCVAPEHFSFIRDAKDELRLALDSQSELHIIPDATISDHGCVVRSAFGSIDARVSTQLTEIKNALLQTALRSEDTQEHE